MKINEILEQAPDRSIRPQQRPSTNQQTIPTSPNGILDTPVPPNWNVGDLRDLLMRDPLHAPGRSLPRAPGLSRHGNNRRSGISDPYVNRSPARGPQDQAPIQPDSPNGGMTRDEYLRYLFPMWQQGLANTMRRMRDPNISQAERQEARQQYQDYLSAGDSVGWNTST